MKRLCQLLLKVVTLAVCAVGGWIDMDTPGSQHEVVSFVDGIKHNLVFSDEFNLDGRSFADGDDSRWTAIHKNDYTNKALQYYDRDHLETKNGYLAIKTTKDKIEFDVLDEETMTHKQLVKNFKSGMIQGWDKFCFTGGIIEVRAKLPGKAYVGGLWPAIWLLGDLTRATFVGSSNYMWPFSYNTCDRAMQKKQLINACMKDPHYELEANTGRGAPEIDILEAMPGKDYTVGSKVNKPYMSTSLQIAPGITKNRPLDDTKPKKGTWYEGLEFGDNSSMNTFFYGVQNSMKNEEYSYQSDAISGNTQLSPEIWEKWHDYRVEWRPPNSLYEGHQGYIRWYMDDELVYGITGESLSVHESALIPSEPMYVILNTAMSSSWGFGSPCPKGCSCECFDCDDITGECACGIPPGFCDSLPAEFLIDSVRVFQDPNSTEKVGCSTPERPTKKWIQGHPSDYMEKGQKSPLLPLKSGGEKCSHDSDCNSLLEAGYCVPSSSSSLDYHHKKVCKCEKGWIGPNCRSQLGFDNIIWNQQEPFRIIWPSFFNSFLIFVSALGVILICTIGYQVLNENKECDKVQIPSESVFSGDTDPAPPSPKMKNSKSYSLIRARSETQLSRMVT